MEAFNVNQILKEDYKKGDEVVFFVGEHGNSLFPYKEIRGHKIASFTEKFKNKDLYVITDKGYVVDVNKIIK